MASGAVLVVGGGIAGLQASLDLADSGFKVYLLEESPSLGGRMAQLDKTFPTNDCSICILSPKLVECGRHPHVELLTYSELLSLQGGPGEFKAKVLKKPRSIREELCTGCGTCVEKCPTKVPSEFDQGRGKRKAIYIPYPQAIPRIPVIDREVCTFFLKGKCRTCEKVCPAGAIDYGQTPLELELEVGAVILAMGYEVLDQDLRLYGYGHLPDVVTSLEFERFLSASGPTGGEVLRPSDGAHPKKVAWVQCVGSRNHQKQRGYCSSVCCMYAIKQAIIAKEHSPGLEAAIFYIDIRAFGKGFDSYYERARSEGIRFVRSLVSKVEGGPEGKGVFLHYVDEGGRFFKEGFDLLVLSVGLKPSESALFTLERLGISVGPYGFLQGVTEEVLSTSRPGVFVCGVLESPKDIPESVCQASGAAALASSLISPMRWKEVKGKVLPPEREVEGEPPRIGVFICHCGVNIAGVVDVQEVAESLKGIPDVVHVETSLFTCAENTQRRIKEVIQQMGLNRVVVAACSPRTHEPLFQQTLREAGLNPYLFEMANIRDQCSWVHMKDKARATEKAKDLVAMAVKAARALRPLKKERVPVKKRALVVGGGLAGMQAALGFARAGFEAVLVEREAELGGNLKRVRWTLTGKDPQRVLEDLKEKVSRDPRIQVVLNAQVVDHEGFQGNFQTGVVIAPTMAYMRFEHGVAVLATGAEELKPKEYAYGQDPRVMTQLEFEEALWKGDPQVLGANAVVMVQCVGSRNQERPYCSRICCQMAVKNALKFKELNPKGEVYVLYRDIRTYGLLETYYRLCREKGVAFLRYEPERPPLVEPLLDGLSVEVWEAVLRRSLRLKADLLVLSTALVPLENEELAALFRVPRTLEGFYQEAHMKLRPVETATPGIFICGLAHWPKLMEESMAQALAVVSRASTILSRDHLEVGGVVARVNPDLCAACLICVRACPYGVPYIDEEGRSVIDPARCRGCGNCAAVCPQKAIELDGFRDEQVLSKLDALLGGL